MQSRRNFINSVAGGLAGTFAASNVLGANDRIRIGIIGPGARGSEILRQALALENVECIGAADVYTRRLEQAKQIAPNAKTYLDYHRLLEDPEIDAVLIATPQHLHCEHFIAAIDAGKHVYQEKTMAFTVEHAKRMRAAYQKAGQAHRADRPPVDLLRPDARCAELPQARADRQDHRDSRAHVSQHAAWKAAVGAARLSGHDSGKHRLEFVSGQAPPHAFDANRYINWRYFWDYSGGNVYENMCHQLSFWYKAMNLSIPTTVTMTGGLYLWKDGREVPDTMNVAMEHPEEIAVQLGFRLRQRSTWRHRRRARRQTARISQRPQGIRYTPQKVNRREGNEMVAPTRSDPNAHMQNFIDYIRGTSPRSPARSTSDSASPSPAAWPWTAIARDARCTGTRQRKRSSEAWISSTHPSRSSCASRCGNSPMAEIAPHVMEWDEAQTFPLEVIRKLGKLGYMGSIFPEELGGAGLGTSSTPSSSRNFRAWMGRWGLSWRPTRRCVRTTSSRWAARNSASATCRNWRPASGSDAGR